VIGLKFVHELVAAPQMLSGFAVGAAIFQLALLARLKAVPVRRQIKRLDPLSRIGTDEAPKVTTDFGRRASESDPLFRCPIVPAAVPQQDGARDGLIGPLSPNDGEGGGGDRGRRRSPQFTRPPGALISIE
jgi:hypothetical protein